MSLVAKPLILGKARIASPIRSPLRVQTHIPLHISYGKKRRREPNYLFESAGPRSRIYFDPPRTKVGIVTCGGICPGLNTVIRSVFLELYHSYGVRHVLGFRNGYKGLDPASGLAPLKFTPELVDDIHKEGGTILGTSRGPVDTGVAVNNLIKRGINILFVVGGDGTQRGGREIFQEAKRRGYPLAVVGIPKTIDNDVPYVSPTFGYQTAVAEAEKVIAGAHVEAKSVENGITLVKLMGRHSGFIAVEATVASQDVNFCLIPEIPFQLHGRRGFLNALKQRILKRSHAVIVVAEGAGQDLLANTGEERDASGNIKLRDIGSFLCGEISDHFKREKIPAVVRCVDPGYIIRSVPASAADMILCDQYARNAVHAAMAGKTGLVIGLLHSRFIHIPVDMLGSHQKRVDPAGPLWHAVLETTGQPYRFE
ncbi:MAG TPA: ATP-dependent 6-phosphofructokinase [Verrucomicrobiae bacterium]